MLLLKRNVFKNLFVWNFKENDNLDHIYDNDHDHITF